MNCCAHYRCSANAGEEGPGVVTIADADGTRLSRKPKVADINIVITCGEIASGAMAQGGVGVAGRVF